MCEAASGRGLRPVVLNADSRQVYVGMDIGTSKIKPSQMRGFEHRLLDVAEPSSKLSLEAYAQMARDELASLAGSENAVPVLVGGGKRSLPRGVRADLELLDSRRFDSGVVFQRYAVRRDVGA